MNSNQGSTTEVSDSKRVAQNLIENAAKFEPALTLMLTESANLRKGEMVGLINKLKSLESLEEKLQRDSKENRVTIAEAASKIGDVLRYTMILPFDTYTQSVKFIISQLETSGYKNIKILNTFDPHLPYMGINTNFESSNGAVFELQFHTKDSYSRKQTSHGIYEAKREPRPDGRHPSTDEYMKREYSRAMIQDNQKILFPKDVESIKNYRFSR